MFSVKDFIVLVEDTGRIIREDKRGAISSSSQDILNRLNIPAENWLNITTKFGSLFKGAVGALPALTVTVRASTSSVELMDVAGV
jgi:hypothetical protein